MSNIYDILNFKFSPSTFSQKGINVVPTNILNMGKSQIAILNDITEKAGKSLIDETPTQGIREVYLKFLKYYHQNKDLPIKFDKRELRTLTYSLTYKENKKESIFENQNYLRKCFILLNETWRDRYIIGLLHCYLSNWNSRSSSSFTHLSKFINEKLNNYKGSRSVYLSFKKNNKFFDRKNGDINLGFTMAISNEPISQLTSFLSLPENWIAYPYFSGAIDGYFEKSKNKIEDVLDDIANALNLHSSGTKGTNTNKLIVSKIICHTVISNEKLQDRVKDIAFRIVGDPGITSIWRPFIGATQNEINTINTAREILNEWVTRQFISVFFEKCINDPRRKRFWLKYSKKITVFKVFGPRQLKRILKSDERISEYVDSRFQSVRSSRDISAFMIRMGDHKMIEFSDPGYAFYAYKINNSNAPDFDEKNVFAVNSFLDGSMPYLLKNRGYDIYHYSEEGRLGHGDSTYTWEEKFEIWITKIAGINV